MVQPWDDVAAARKPLGELTARIPWGNQEGKPCKKIKKPLENHGIHMGNRKETNGT